MEEWVRIRQRVLREGVSKRQITAQERIFLQTISENIGIQYPLP